MRLLPFAVVIDQVRQKVRGQSLILGHQGPGAEGVGGREAVEAGGASSSKPELRVVGKVLAIPQPAAFVEVMRRRRTDRVVFAGPGNLGEEFGDDEAFGRLLDVLPVGPPAEVVRLFQALVRAFEERNVSLQPLPGRSVVDASRFPLRVVGVEPLDVVPERVHTQDPPGVSLGLLPGHERHPQKEDREPAGDDGPHVISSA